MFIDKGHISYFTDGHKQILYHLFSEKLIKDGKVLKVKPEYICGTRMLIQADKGKYLLLAGINSDGSFNTNKIKLETLQNLAALMMLNEDPIIQEKFCHLVLSIMDENRKLYDVNGTVIIDFNKWSPSYRYTYEMLLLAAKRCGLKDAARELLKFRFSDKLLKFFAKPPVISNKFDPTLVSKASFIKILR